MNKITVALLGVLCAIALGISVFTITKNNNLKESIVMFQEESLKLSNELQKNQDKATNLEVQKDKLQAVLNKVSPWLDKEYYDSVIGSKLDNENKSLFPAPPAITPRELDNKLTLLITALQQKTSTDKDASQKTIKKIDELKAPIMDEIGKIFESFDKFRGELNTISTLNQQLHKEKEELMTSSNQKVEKLNQEIAALREESSGKLATARDSYQTQLNEVTKKYEQRIASLRDSTNVETSSLKDKISKEKGAIKEDNQKKMAQLQDLVADLNTLTEKSFENYYQTKKKSYTGILFTNKKMVEDLDKEKENFYIRFNGIKDASQKIFGVAKENTAKEKSVDVNVNK
ncbi:hypothetical protein HZA55_07935 [Candidatus Poribacteria bacterium]|nr:hypothetical protein [Candidatus Poribacteria bacterium]